MNTTPMNTTPKNPAPAALSWLLWTAADTWVVARRHLLRLTKRPDELLGTLMIPVMAVVMFGFVWGDALGAALEMPGVQYRELLLPGLFALTMAFGIGSTTTSVAADVQGGVLARMRTLPASPVTLLAGRAVADLVIAVVELSILIGLGQLLGWQWHGGLLAGLAALCLLLLLRLAFSCVGILAGVLVSSAEAAMKYFALVFPLAMVADTVVPTSLMPPWLAEVAAYNPLSATALATRSLSGHPTAPATTWVAEHASVMAVGWPVAIMATSMLLAVLRLRRLGR